MPVYSVESALSSVKESTSGVYTAEQIEDALINVYIRTIEDRRSRGDIHDGFSREEYRKYRVSGEPSVKVMLRYFGSWSVAKSIIPRNTSRRRYGIRKKGSALLTECIRDFNDAAKFCGTNKASLGKRGYERWRAEVNPQAPHWQMYATAIVHERTWSKLKRRIIEEEYRRGQ